MMNGLCCAIDYVRSLLSVQALQEDADKAAGLLTSMEEVQKSSEAVHKKTSDLLLENAGRIQKVLAMEEDVNSLKERVFRSKATLQLLKEIVVQGSSTGSRGSIVHVNKLASDVHTITINSVAFLATRLILKFYKCILIITKLLAFPTYITRIQILAVT